MNQNLIGVFVGITLMLIYVLLLFKFGPSNPLDGDRFIFYGILMAAAYVCILHWIA